MKLFAIIHEDENFLVINKPTGLVVHPFDHSDEVTLLDMLTECAPSVDSFENTVTLQDKRVINLGGIVHKLDRETSGVMVIAKNKKTFDTLREQFIGHTIQKTYVAVVEGKLSEKTFTIDAPLGREKKGYRQVVRPENARGELRDAVTDVRVVEEREETSLVELSPRTGRTHQLRAHMSYVGHPIIGDKVYGDKTKDAARLMLHAQKISFVVEGKTWEFEAEIPSDFKDVA